VLAGKEAECVEQGIPEIQQGRLMSFWSEVANSRFQRSVVLE